MNKKIIEILNGIKGGIDYEKEQGIMSAKVLDSIQMVEVIMKISEEFQIEIDYKCIIPENFDSVEKMAAYIRNVKNEVCF